MIKTVFFGLLAILLVFGLIGCDNGNGPNGDKPFISGTLSSINQSLSMQGISRSIAPEAASQTFSANLGSDNKTLTGLLRDGSITFALTGEYDATTKVFSMQAPSSMMIFSIVGKLSANNALDIASTSASVSIKEGNEWSRIALAVSASNQTVEGTANADTTGVTTIPAYCRGTFTDQVLGGILRYTITRNSITMFDGDLPPQDFTVVEVTNADGSPANENGPWNFIVRAKYFYGNNWEFSVDYTGKFYVSKTFDAKLTADIGSSPVSDLFFGEAIPDGSTPISTAVNQFSGVHAFVAPYCGSGANVSTSGIYPATGVFSPMFIGSTATTNAKAANTLKAISGFTLVLK